MWDGIDDKKSSWAVCLENEIIFHHRMDFAKHITRFFGETGVLWLPARPACHPPALLPNAVMLYIYILSQLFGGLRQVRYITPAGVPKELSKNPFCNLPTFAC